MARRKQIWWNLKGRGRHNADVLLTFTRKGIEVSGYFDSIVDIGETVLIPWDEVDAYRQELNSRTPRPATAQRPPP